MLKTFLLGLLQISALWVLRPYVARELPGWGKLYKFIGNYKRDWLWTGAPAKTLTGKMHGFKMHLDLTKWSDRSTYLLGRWYDLEMQLFMRDVVRQGDAVVDVGANRGNFALVASRLVGEKGRVICFEPNPDCRRILDRELTSNYIENVLVCPFGLGERADELTLTVPVINSGEATFGRSAYSSDGTYQVKAKIEKGDDVLRECKTSLIKIDVEGFECEVIAGLVETIHRYHPIIITEVVAKHLAACGGSIGRLMDLMHEHGYEGYMLGLKKARWRYLWQLSPIDIVDHSYDAVWAHPLLNKDIEKILQNHIA